MRASLLLVGLTGLAVIAAAPGAAAKTDRPFTGADRMAEPAQPAPDDGSRKRFLKAEPSRAPRLSPKPDGVGPILAPLSLKGHRDSPPKTTDPLKPDRRLPPPAVQ